MNWLHNLMIKSNVQGSKNSAIFKLYIIFEIGNDFKLLIEPQFDLFK